ncbi:SDR family oxidoreductase [Terrabacter terrigena]|uniref:SDR family oxidoreductase n=1 Tax=Terrabacter terrigena TaxID=574718 RepID=A0ABW3MWF3_9MICO
MDLGLDGRVALVLASTGGLGAAVATALAAEGAHVVVTGRDAARAQALAARLPSAVGVGVDLTAPGAAATVLAATREAFGDPEVLVLNGPGPPPSRAADLDGAAVRAAAETLLVPHVDLVQQALPAMRARRWGRILAIGSSGVEAPLPDLSASNVGRAALAAYLKTLAGEVAADGVTVNMLLPGRIATDRVAALDAAAATRQGRPVDEVEAASRATIPLGRYGEPEEFGATGAFLCSARASYLTGALVRCDGGLLANL